MKNRCCHQKAQSGLCYKFDLQIKGQTFKQQKKMFLGKQPILRKISKKASAGQIYCTYKVELDFSPRSKSRGVSKTMSLIIRLGLFCPEETGARLSFGPLC